jgi:DNA-binding NarL/FixJ family response regulator
MPPRILIVDDSSLIRNLLRTCFEAQSGWEVSGEAGNGQEGIAKAQQVHPNLIVLDLSMPVMNGLDTARALSKLMPSVPLVMFTSFMTSNLERDALEAGISKVIIKSGALTDLIGCVRSLVKDAA